MNTISISAQRQTVLLSVLLRKTPRYFWADTDAAVDAVC